MVNNGDACGSFPAEDCYLTVDDRPGCFSGPDVLVPLGRENDVVVNRFKTAIFSGKGPALRGALMATTDSLHRLTLMLCSWWP
jgi:hypothetical protein